MFLTVVMRAIIHSRARSFSTEVFSITYTHTRAHTHTHTHTHTHAHIRTHTRTHAHTRTHIESHTHTHILPADGAPYPKNSHAKKSLTLQQSATTINWHCNTLSTIGWLQLIGSSKS